MLRYAPALTVGAFLLPIVAGLVGTLLPAFGYLPAIGGHEFSLEPWRRLVAYPGFATSLCVTLFVGIGTAVLAVLLALFFCAWAYGRPRLRRIGAWIAPILATPHSALAIGLAFLIAPSGWIARAISPWLSGWTLPPDVATVGDPRGLALMLGLLVKEVPYLVLMIVGALHQIPVRQHMTIARALGYSREAAWIKVILPQVYPQIRLPVFAVVAFSLSVVDVALILGPSNPPPLAVLAVRWFGDADIAFYFPAAAAAMLLLFIVATVLAVWYGAERVARVAGRQWLSRGERNGTATSAAGLAADVCAILLASAFLALAGMTLWSFAEQWRFPEALPQAWSLANWRARLTGLAGPAWTTLAIGALATSIALTLCVACLENEGGAKLNDPHARFARCPPRGRNSRSGRPFALIDPHARFARCPPRGRSRFLGAALRNRRNRSARAGAGALWLLYVPLLVPQVAFLFGAQVLLVRLGLDGSLAAVVWAHLVFVLPYLFLSLADPWRAFDPRYARSAASLGAGPARVLFAVKLPILLGPVLIASAIAFAVSVGQYLPTLFAGNGRVATLTTEAVTLAAGADRRVIAAYALAQALLPLAAYLAAAMLPTLLFANRRGHGLSR